MATVAESHASTGAAVTVSPPASVGSGIAEPKSILKHSNSRKRRSLQWDEGNLDENEQERIERGPRMKIDEPKTPYQAPHRLRSPEQLDAGGSSDLGGSAPTAFSLDDGERLSAEALQRRAADEKEWEDDEEEQQTDGTEAQPMQAVEQTPTITPQAGSKSPASPARTAAAAAKPSSPAAAAAAAAARSAAASNRSPPVVAEGSLEGAARLEEIDLHAAGDSLPPDLKHEIFAKKKKHNYSHMGDLLKKRPPVDDDDEDNL